MADEQDLAGIVDERVEEFWQPLGAALEDAHKREPLMAVGRRKDFVENLGNPVDGLGDERDILHAERHASAG